MSFQNKGLWMGKTTECLTDSEISYDSSSKMEPKRPHQWFMDNSDIELFPNKKQAVEVPNNNLFAAISTSNVSLWGNASGFNTMPAQFAERLFDSDSVRTVNFDARNMGSVGTGDMNMGRKVVEDPFANESMFGLSMSHSLEDPRSGFNYGGIRKVKVSQVKDSENVMSMSTGHTFTMENNDMSVGHAYNKAESNSISMGLAYSKGDDNFISTGRTYDREGNSFISMGQPYNKGDGNVDNVSIGSPYKGNDNALLTSNLFSKDDNRIISMGQSYNKEDENAMSTRQSYIDGGNNIVTMRHTYDKGDENILSMSHIYNKGDGSTISMCSPYNKDENNTLSMGHLYNKGDSHIISFGGYDDDTNPPGRLICSYDLLMRQPSIQRSDALNEKELAKSNVESRANSAQMPHPGNESTLKRKEEQKLKKEPPNSFPSNVRSLLSTGMLDGVSVKYIAWSREELRGVIKGSGYLCGCQSCNFFKVINAYEFERHADCKTKHPNNHIYFENGKTVYGIVQELRSTPQNMLFDVIQTITGSPINQKSFRLWKESFLAATRELQRIYGTS